MTDPLRRNERNDSIDPRPICRFCGAKWLPREGVDATKHFCSGCSEERRRVSAERFAADGKHTVSVGGHELRVPAIQYVTERVKPLGRVTASDVPVGLEPEDVATQCPECGDVHCSAWAFNGARCVALEEK